MSSPAGLDLVRAVRPPDRTAPPRPSRGRTQKVLAARTPQVRGAPTKPRRSVAPVAGTRTPKTASRVCGNLVRKYFSLVRFSPNNARLQLLSGPVRVMRPL